MRSPRSRSYTADAAGPISSPSNTLLILGGSASVRLSITDVLLSFSAIPGDSGLSVMAQRTTSLGQSTPVTPRQLDPADPAASALVGANCSVEPSYTAGAVLLNVPLNERASVRWQAHRQGGLIVPAVTGAGLGLFGVHSAVAPVMRVTIYFSETGSTRMFVSGPSVTIWYTSRDSIVNVNYNATTYVMQRPVVHAWTFAPVGTTYWVATDGNDVYAGSSGYPFRTIAKALSVAVAGDLIYVRPGTYTETVTITTSGTPDTPLVLSRAPGLMDSDHVILKRPAGHIMLSPSVDVLSIQASDVWVNGFVVEGTMGQTGAASDPNALDKQSGIGSDTNSANVRVTNCATYNNIGPGIVLGGPGSTVEGCVVFKNGLGVQDHGIDLSGQYVNTANGNIVFDNAGYGIYSVASDTSTILANLCFLNGNPGIVCTGPDGTVQYNTSAKNSDGFQYFDTTRNTYVDHNIWAHNTRRAVTGTNQVPQDNEDDYNAIHGSYRPGNYGANEIFDQDPLFASMATGGFTLLAGSPCPDFGCYVAPLL